MATAVRTGETHGAAGAPCAWPALDSFEETARKARRALAGAGLATEEFTAGASLEVRRHPLTAVGLATAAGVFTGCLFGLAAGWYLTRSK
jgi:hypothetical protein